jgi:hypothetical protein
MHGRTAIPGRYRVRRLTGRSRTDGKRPPRRPSGPGATTRGFTNASFAGQHDNYLNVVGSRVDFLEHVSRCWASLFRDRAVSLPPAKGRLTNGRFGWQVGGTADGVAPKAAGSALQRPTR